MSSGVRRIEALTGEAARHWLSDRDARLREAAAALKTSPDEVPARVAALVEERKRLERELADAKKALAMGGGAASPTPPDPKRSAATSSSARSWKASIPRSLRATVDDDEAARRLGRCRAGRGQ